MIKVPLTGKGKGLFALIDDQFDYLLKYKWHVNDKGYVVGYVEGKAKRIHRLITGEPIGMDVDHEDGDKLNNLLSNLRVCTHRLNCFNNKLSKRNKSGHKGVYPRHNRWRAVIQYDGRLRHLGTFETKLQAHEAYAKAARLYHGEFARVV
jgi:HNH endonuclease